ncbi:hypothetical protein ACFX2H_035546 [Malus domestica]
MANLAKLDYATLDITRKNYLTWVLDTKIHLEAGNLGDSIREESSSSSQEQAKAMIFISCHLDEVLKSEYLTVEDPLTLWNALRSRYNHQTMVILPRTRYEWTHLKIQDFKSGVEYNYALFRITSQLKLCGNTITKENLLEKTFSTFHASKVLMQQYYRARGFTEYNQLISVLQVAEQNNELLMKNHNSRPIGFAPFPKVNAASLEVNATSSGGDNHKRGRGHKQGRWNRKSKNHGGQFHNQVLRHNSGPSFKNVNRHKGKAHMNNAPRNSKGACHRCGGNGHWMHTCCTPKHLVDLYQASLKEKGVETNFLNQAKPMDIPDQVCDLSGQDIAITNDNPCKTCSQGKLVIRPSQLKITKLRAQFPNYPIKSIRLDNAGEFTSQTFDDYCMTLGIDVEHPVPHVHTQNGLVKALIKRLQLIARTLLMKTTLPVSALGHAILHAASLRRLGIYVGFDSSSIIRYLEPLTCDMFTTRFADCHFDETVFPSSGGEKTVLE